MANKLELYRKQFSTTPYIHLNNAGQAPTCIPAQQAIEKWIRFFGQEGSNGYPALAPALDQARARLAQFLGCHAEQVAFMQSAAAAISQVAFGLNLKPGDEVLVWDQEYPSNFYPWKMATEKAGAKLVVVGSAEDLSTPVEILEKYVTPRTKVIATSWVQYRTGATMDLKALATFARPRGIFTSVDGIQGLGCLPFHFEELGLDAVSGGSHKWLAAMHGVGFLCLRREHIEKLPPLLVGALTMGTPNELSNLNATPRKDAQRFEPGSLAYLEILGLGAAVDLILNTGIAVVSQAAGDLANHLKAGLRDRGYQVHLPRGSHSAHAIVNFGPGEKSPLKSLAEIEARLQKNRVVFVLRPPGIRLSPHAFNTVEQLDLVLNQLR